MKAYTEVQNYVRRFSSIDPEQDITVLEGNRGTEIYSIGEDKALYLTYENDGNESRFTRTKILKKAEEFAAIKITGTGRTAVAAADGERVVLAVTEHPETLTDTDFDRINLDGMLEGKKMKPFNLLICALEKGITLFVEMKDEGGRIEQFACLLDSDNPRAVRYFPLASNYSSVVCSAPGRATGQYVDGIYTCGEYGGTKQLLYTPSCNVFGETQPAPLRLKNEFKVETICTLPLSGRTGTHLFAVGDGGLYFYPCDRQRDMYHLDHPDPDFEVASELFNEAKKAAAVIFDNKVYVYVLNESNILSYTYAEYYHNRPSDFKEPVRLMEQVFYFDISGGNTMNICTADKAIFGTRDPITGNWGFSEAHISTDLDESRIMSAYVTRISTDMGNEEVTVRVNGKRKASCYVNGIYHNFLRLSVKTDAAGSITIVQEARDLNPACFVVSDGKEDMEVNPGDYAHSQVMSLGNVGQARAAVITAPDGTKSSLFGHTDDTSLNMAASGILSLGGAANSIIPGYVTSQVEKFSNGIIVKITDKLISILPYDATHNPFVSFLTEIVHDVEYAFNWVRDKVKWLYDHTIAPVVDFVIGKVNEVWKFVVKIGEKILDVAIDTIRGVFGAVKKLLELIGIPIDKIFDWLKKALNLDAVDRTNAVMKQMIRLSGQKLVRQTAVFKEDVLERMEGIIESVEKWAEIDTGDIRKAAGDIVNKNLGGTGFDLTPHNTYMLDTMFGGLNMNEIVMPQFVVSPALSGVLDKLGQAITNETALWGEMTGTVLSIGENIYGILGSGDILDVCGQLKQILGKVAVAGLKLCQSIIGLVLDVVTEVVEVLIDLVLSPIHLPFISQVLKLFGVDEFSIADLITYPAAFLVTNVTLIATGQPLFSPQTCDAIMNAQSIDQLATVF